MTLPLEVHLRVDLATLFLAGACDAPLEEVQIYLDAADGALEPVMEYLREAGGGAR